MKLEFEFGEKTRETRVSNSSLQTLIMSHELFDVCFKEKLVGAFVIRGLLTWDLITWNISNWGLLTWGLSTLGPFNSMAL